MTELVCHPHVRRLIQLALEEDLGFGDVTSVACLPPSAKAQGEIVARESGTLAGLEVARAVFEAVDSRIEWQSRLRDGAVLEPGQQIAQVSGPALSVLAAERTALNFLQLLSGMATLTAQYVQAVAPLPVRVVDTRKTIPGWRLLSKYAVRVGGGHNHRIGLADGVLIKDNHIAVAGSVREAVRRARENAPHSLRVEVEVETLDQLQEALEAGADVVLLDNMDLETLRRAVALAKGRVLLEASGGIDLKTIRAVAETGVDLISTSRITLDARPVDFALEVVVQ
ncbi:MAG: nicotinate-nucleotide diphosphorylase (carboxylating) [Candidatus Poribacteria bacterium]|nr:MAG: nicotinate-nucleotide diphosphorylase (carboxylating) [Candidatus Poribacteria bacterium]